MRLIKGGKAKREEPRNEDRFQFPAIQETWEVSCECRPTRSQLPTSNNHARGFVGRWELEVGRSAS